MAAAGRVSCRAFTALRFEMTRVLSVTSLTPSRKYQNETWCRRWWGISQRGLTSTSSFRTSLSPILTKSTKNSKNSKNSEEKNNETENTEASAVTVTYHKGLPRITIPLPSRSEKCMFVLKPITHTVGDFLSMLRNEDRGIDRAAVTTIDGTRIGSSNTIESLMEETFKLIVNDKVYTISPPELEKFSSENLQKLSDVHTLVSQLYESLHVREHQAELEKQVMLQLEDVMLELEPLEQKRQELEVTAARKANLAMWIGLIMMSVQFGTLARLTWWEYSWDIMEPVTYFVTYGTIIGCYIYFLLTKQECVLPDVLNRRHLLVLHKKAKKVGLDVEHYNRLKDQAYELETTLRIIRGPLWSQKKIIEERKQTKWENSRNSRSPSSSPSRSPSPDRTFQKNRPLTTVISS